MLMVFAYCLEGNLSTVFPLVHRQSFVDDVMQIGQYVS